MVQLSGGFITNLYIVETLSILLDYATDHQIFNKFKQRKENYNFLQCFVIQPNVIPHQEGFTLFIHASFSSNLKIGIVFVLAKLGQIEMVVFMW